MKNRLYDKFSEVVAAAQKILIVGHRKPDGDALGSMCALKLYFESLGKEVSQACVDKPSKKYSFLPGIKTVETDIRPDWQDLIVIVDCGAHYMTNFHEKYPTLITVDNPDMEMGNGRPYIVNIDHHSSNDRFGNLNIVEEESASATTIIYKIFDYLEWKITPEIATCLLTGIYNDTGSFMHSNTSNEVMKAAGELLRFGAKISPIIKALFRSNSVETLKTWGKVFSNSRITGDNFLLSIIKKEDIDPDGDMEHMAGAIDYLNMVPDVDFTMLVKEDGGHVKGSLRTKRDDVDLSEIAKKFGGGGHAKAAGFSIKGTLDDVFGK